MHVSVVELSHFQKFQPQSLAQVEASKVIQLSLSTACIEGQRVMPTASTCRLLLPYPRGDIGICGKISQPITKQL